MNTKVALIRLKVFEAADAATLESAYEAWRESQGENTFVDARLAQVGTNIVLTVFYTK